MDIPDNPPTIGKSQLLDNQFGVWWKFLNSLGVASFLMFTQCVGLAEWRYPAALLGCVLVMWGYCYGMRYFPPFVRHLRNQGSGAARNLESAVWRDYLFRKPWAYVPMYVGVFTLFGLAATPAINRDWHANFRIDASWLQTATMKAPRGDATNALVPCVESIR